jgi:hypothetical protein
MASDTREDLPHQFLRCRWPQEFKSRRRFPRQIENEPFIEYCQHGQFPRQIENQPSIGNPQDPSDGNGDDRNVEDRGTYGDNSDENDESEGEESQEDDSEESEDEEDEEENQYGDGKKEEKNQSNQTGDKNAEAWNSRSTIRKFMEGFIGDEETLPYPDQVEKVVAFCEQGSSTKSNKYVALLNDTNDGGTGPKKRPYCRSYKGPLTSQKFRNELEKQVL